MCRASPGLHDCFTAIMQTSKIQDFPSSRLNTVVVVYSYDCLLLYLCAVTGLNCLLSLKRYEGVALYRFNCVQLFWGRYVLPS